MFYSTKIIDYHFKKRVVSYAVPIRKGGHNHATRQKYQDMSEEQKKISDERRLKYYRKKSEELVNFALMNPFKVMITVTFREHITDYRVAIKYWKNFIKRLKYSFGSDITYLCTWERMTKRAKERIHFHALLNVELTHKELKNLWRYGNVWVSKIKGGREGRKAASRYMIKYMTKSIEERIESGESVRGERFFFCSKNIEKPKVETLEESINIQDVIFENMENVIKDGQYTVRDGLGNNLNKIEYVEFLK